MNWISFYNLLENEKRNKISNNEKRMPKTN